MKNKNKKEVKKDEFRKNNSKKGRGHPAYIYARIGNEYKYIGITHSDITDNVKNIKLEVNPNPKDKKTAYVKPKTEKEKANKFSKPLDSWKFNKNDKPKIDKIKKK